MTQKGAGDARATRRSD